MRAVSPLLRQALSDLQAGRLSFAARAATAATRIAPDLYEARLTKALACHHAGDQPTALREYAHAVRCAPNDLKAKRHLLQYALANGLHASALQHLAQWLVTDTSLLQDPLVLALLRTHPKPLGYCTRHEDAIVGWAIGLSGKRLQIEADGQYIEIVADRPTPELRAAGLGDGHNGFAFRLPLAVRSARLGIEGHSLWGSPIGHPLLPVAVPPRRTPARAETVDVVIPVYGNPCETLACIASVRTARNTIRHRIVVVDDHSLDANLIHELQALYRQGAITLVRRPFNAGFSVAVNTALPLCGGHDVVLLNSDTLVADGWLDRLQNAAYSHRTVATVTPLSNNAELLSHPQPMQAAPVPDAATLAVINEALAVMGASPVPVPTGVGFCLYVRHDALAAMHGLEETVYQRGYAEDTDLCLRAAAVGWTHRAASDVYVAHHGNGSFGSSKSWLAVVNVEKLRQRFPTHDQDYDRYLAQDPLQRCRRQLQRALLARLVAPIGLHCRVRTDEPASAPSADTPAAWLVLRATTATLQFAGVPVLERIDYQGASARTELAADLASCGFAALLWQVADTRLADRIRTWKLSALPLKPELAPCRLPEFDLSNADPQTLLLPPIADTHALTQVASFAEALAAASAAHQLVVLGSSYAADWLSSLGHVQFVDGVERGDVAQVAKEFRCTAIVIAEGANATDWQDIGAALGLPVLRLPGTFRHADKRPLAALRPKKTKRTGKVMSSSGKDARNDSDSDPGNNPRYEGCVVGLDGMLLHGWARDTERPWLALAVELEIDGLVVDIARANLRQVLGADRGSALPSDCQFMFVVPDTWRDKAGSLRVRIANTAVYLPGEIRLQQPVEPIQGTQSKKRSRALSSWVANHHGLRVFGYAIDSELPIRHLHIRVRYKGEVVAQTVANQPAAELRESDLFDPNHGFSVTLPMQYADGQSRLIQVLDEEGRELRGSPLLVRCTDQRMPDWVKHRGLPDSEAALLSSVFEVAQQHLPMSVDFSAYPEWKARFGTSDVIPTTDRVLVVVGHRQATPDEHAQTLQSVLSQSHSSLSVLSTQAQADERVTIIRKTGFASALKSAIRRHDYIAYLEPGDTWHPNTLAHAIAALKDSSARVSYADCDFKESVLPWFKPNWCPDIFLRQPLLHHGFVAQASLVKDGALEGALPADWPWLIAAYLGDDARAYVHVPHPHHTACGTMPRPSAHALQAVATRWGVEIAVEGAASVSDFGHRVSYPDPIWPTVTLIVPTRDGLDYLRPCIESLRHTDYPAFTITVVDNGSSDADTLAYLADLEVQGVTVLRWPYPFNFSAINNAAVREADTDLVCLVNNDIEAPDPGWLKAMVRQLMRSGVGAVGAKLLWPNGMVQHAGVQLGLHDLAGHVGNNWHATDTGYHQIATYVRSVSAVTAACLLVRRADYLAVGGMDEHAFPVAFNDVDFCLRVRSAGHRIVWTPEVTLIHAESVSRGEDDLPPKRARLDREKARLWERWQDLLFNDPYYNPNLNLDRYSHSGLAMPPRYP